MRPFPRPKRNPILLSILTFIAIAFVFFANLFSRQLSDSFFRFDLAVINIITAVLVFSFSIAWMIWLWFVSGWSTVYSRLIPIAYLLLSIGFLVIFEPKLRGGLGIDRWEPRYWSTRNLELEHENVTVDLSSQTPYDFPQFLGPNRNGVVENFATEFVDISTQASLLWKTAVGEGWSGFAAANGFAVTMMQYEEEELVVCFDIYTGARRWTYRHVRRHDDFLGGLGPRATPTIADGRVYAVGANGLFVCLNASNGELVWSHDLSKLLGIEIVESRSSTGLAQQTEDATIQWGRSGSPLVVDDLVVVPGGGPRGGKQVSLIAFDRLTGEEKWRGGDDGIGYSSPVVAELAGHRQIISVNESSITGHAIATGDSLWSFDWPGHSDSDANTSQPTIVDSNRILLSKGYGVGAELINITRVNGEFRAESAWKNQRVLKTKMTSPVVSGGFAYGLSDGILECVDLEDGYRRWKMGRFGHGQLLLVGDKLLVHAEKGELILIEAFPSTLVERGRIKTINGICWNTLCTFRNVVLVRSDLEAACFQIDEAPKREFEANDSAK